MSLFSELKSEDDSSNFQTGKLSAAFGSDQSLVDRMCRICAQIVKNFINFDDYVVRVEEGSLTFQHMNSHHRVIKVFVDLNNEICSVNGISASPNPIAIGIEFSKEDPFVRKALREEIRRVFANDNYLDPARGFPKYSLKPQYTHSYDVVILKSECTCPYDEADYNYFRERIVEELEVGGVAEAESITADIKNSTEK